MATTIEKPQRFSAHTYVLVAGRSDYQPPLAPLPAVETELHALVDALTDPNGCAVPTDNVVLLAGSHCTTSAIKAALIEYQGALGADDVLLVYFAGHGETTESGFRLLAESDGSDAVDSKLLDQLLNGIQARGVLLILDCCGGGGLAERAPSFFQSLGRADFRGLLSSTREHQSSWELMDPPGSLFTQRLIAVLTGDEQLDASGGIYLTQLVEFLRLHVVADSEALGTRQEPMFSGAYAEDPLLFLHRNLTLSRVRVRYGRVTREQMMRRVRRTAGVLLSVIVLLVGTFWAWMDGHRYLSLTGDQVTLTHGYPGWSGFGLPQELWQYDVSREHLATDSPLLAGIPVTFDRNASSHARLTDQLSLVGHVAVRIWGGQLAEPVPLAELRTYLSSVGSVVDGLRFSALEPALVAQLRQLANEDAEVAYPALTILSEHDADYAGTILANRVAGSEVGQQLNLIALWRAPCSDGIQRWMTAYGKADANYLFYPTLVDATLRSGCRLDMDDVLAAHTRQLRTAALGFRFANPNEASELAAELARLFDAPAASINPTAGDSTNTRLMRLARYLGAPMCPLHVRADLTDAATAQDFMAVLLKGCLEASIVTTTPTHINVVVENNDYAFPIGRGLDVVHMINVLEDVDYSERSTLYRDWLARAEQADVVRVLAQQLARLGAQASAYDLDRYWDRPDVQIALLQWTLQTDPTAVAEALIAKMIPGVATEYLTVSAGLPSFAESFLERAQSLDVADRVLLETLHTDADRVVELLNSPNRLERETAGMYAVVRADREAIWAAAQARSNMPTQVMMRTKGRLQQLQDALADLESMPDWACWWRLELIESQRPLDYGLALALDTYGEPICKRKDKEKKNGRTD